MFCRKCGHEIPDGVAFCTKCGANLAEQKTAAEAPENGTQGGVRKKKRYPLIIGIGIALTLVLVLVLLYVLVLSPAAKTKREVREQMALAERYLDDLDYEKAIAAYQAVLEIDPKNEEALEGLEEAYIAWAESVAESDPDAADKIYEEAIKYLQRNASGNDVGSFSRQYEEVIDRLSEKMQNPPDTDNDTEVEVETQHDGSLVLTIVGANDTGNLKGAEVSIVSADGQYSEEQTADEEGRVTFIFPDSGEYTITASADGYSERSMVMNLMGGTLTKSFALAPEIRGDDACVLVVWQGDCDIDICCFNAELKEYVNIANPIDSAEKSILFADHGAAERYEMLYLHDISDPVARSIYVMDTNSAQGGSSSDMERDGVDTYVYDSSGLIYHIKADPAETASVWQPCYCYESEVYETDEYYYDLSEFSWISLSADDQGLGQGGSLNAEDITLTQDDIYMLESMANYYRDHCGNAGLLTRDQLQDEMRQHPSPPLYYLLCRFEPVETWETVDDPNVQGGITDYCKYSAEPVVELVHDLYGIELDPNVNMNESDGWGFGCSYEDGYVISETPVGMEYSDYTELAQTKIVDGRLDVIMACYNDYDFDWNTNLPNVEGYVSIYLSPSNNGLGYEIYAVQNQVISNW